MSRRIGDNKDDDGHRAGQASLPPPASQLPSSDAIVRPLAAQIGDLGGPSSTGHRRVAEKTSSLLEHNNGLDNGQTNELNVVAAYKAHFREDPLAFLQQVWAYGQGSGWRGCACQVVVVWLSDGGQHTPWFAADLFTLHMLRYRLHRRSNSLSRPVRGSDPRNHEQRPGPPQDRYPG